MRHAGWIRSMPNTYMSPNGTRFSPDNWTVEKGVLWGWYAERNLLPQEKENDDEFGLRIAD